MDSNNAGETLRRLYYRYRQVMYNAAFRLLGDAELAEDAVHDAFVSLSSNLSRIDEEDVPRTRAYCVTICRNAARKLLRKHKKYIQPPEALDIGEAPDTLTLVINRDTLRRLTEAVYGLDEKYRDVFLLKYDVGHSIAEIAELCGLSEDAVYKRLERAKKLLAHALKLEGIQ